MRFPKVRAVLLDFDGTLSTLRSGWEEIMRPLMLEMIAGPHPPDKALAEEVEQYIDASTGVQTIHQMKWLCEAVRRHGLRPGMPDDPWWYKGEYNRRLMERVNARLSALSKGQAVREQFLIHGSERFLSRLHELGMKLYAASGTDHADVLREAQVLDIAHFFTQIEGAQPGREDCSKEKTMRQLLHMQGLHGPELLVIGDGRVEIALGRQSGALTLGVASDETRRTGINPAKLGRLTAAGADRIVGDYQDTDAIVRWIQEGGDENV